MGKQFFLIIDAWFSIFFENFNLLTLVSIRRNLGIYYFLREYSRLMLKNNIRTGFVRFRSILVEISYLGRVFISMVTFLSRREKNANPPLRSASVIKKTIFRKLHKRFEYFSID